MFQEVLEKNNKEPDEVTNKEGSVSKSDQISNKEATADKTQTPVSGDAKPTENPEVEKKAGRPKRECKKKDAKEKTVPPKK